MQAEYEEMERLLVAYAGPIQEVEKVIRQAEQEQLKEQFEKQRQESLYAMKREKAEKERRQQKLKEEQERGLSIVLGFSYLETPDGVLDLIDVPGHEDFIRTMISGATGIDGVLLIVAANEGVMPQTREHFDIAQLLGVDRGLIILTKADLVSEEEIELAEEEILEYVEGSFLEGAPVIRTSALKGQGLDDLRASLREIASRERLEEELRIAAQIGTQFQIEHGIDLFKESADQDTD